MAARSYRKWLVELLAEIERVNTEGLGHRVVIGYVKALNPSLDIEFTIQVVCEIFGAIHGDILGIDYKELGLYTSLTRTPEEIRGVWAAQYVGKRYCFSTVL